LNYRFIDIVIYPNYYIGRRIDLNSIHQYIAAPFSIVIVNPINVLEEITSIVKEIYVVEKDAWIDSRKVDLVDFIEILEQVFNVLNQCSTGVFEREDYVIEVKCVDEDCSDIIVVDYVNAPLNWIVENSILFFEKDLINEVVSRKPVEHVLSYVKCSDRYIPLLVYKTSLFKTKIEYFISKNCKSIEKYILWSLIDILLKK